MSVACGQCLGCRIDRTRHWAARIIHEAQKYDDNCFITLTYRDISQCNEEQRKLGLHLPPFPHSLQKSHFQKFMKRLRKAFPGQKIRYYQCGEYGDHNQRPHYHACIFNLQFPDLELFSENHGFPLFTSKILEDLWQFGFCTVGMLDYEAAAYTARYVLKKITGPAAQDHYLRFDAYGVCHWVEPEYVTMSRGGKSGKGQWCGIGADWLQQYHQDVYPSDEVPVPGKGVVLGTPRYYDKWLEENHPAIFKEVKAKRNQYLKDHQEDLTPLMLESKYKCIKARQQFFSRDL